MPVFDYDPPERFVAGAVGQPGARAFFLQARAEGRLTTVALEKFQVAALAERLDELLDEVLRRSGGAAQVPAMAPAELTDDAPLDAAARRRTSGSAPWRWPGTPTPRRWSSRRRRSIDDEERAVDEPPEPAMLRVRISAGAARAFTQRALKVVAAGRPPCPLCGQPLDAEGHICVRLNGYRGGEAAS